MNTNLTKNIVSTVVALQLLLLFSFGNFCYGQTHFQRSVMRVEGSALYSSSPIQIPLPADCHDARIGVRLFYSGENNTPQSWNFNTSFTLTPVSTMPCAVGDNCASSTIWLALRQDWDVNNHPTHQTFIAGEIFRFQYKKSDFEPGSGDPTIPNNPLYTDIILNSGVSNTSPAAPVGNIYAEIEVYTTSLTPLNPTTGFNFSKKELNNNEKVLLFWDYVEGAVSYELEWAHLDAYTTLPGYGAEMAQLSASELENLPLSLPFQEKEPVRIVTSNQHFELPLTYPAGFLFYRVRPIGYYEIAKDVLADAPKERMVGAWQYGTLDGAKKRLVTQLNEDFEADKLWQVVTTFAEEGKFKKVVSYLDGSSRSRQTVTHSNSDATILVAEQFYNYEGAANVQILPTPLMGSGLHYRADVNFFTDQNGDKTRDKSSYDGAIARLHTSFGAARYYSANNPFLNSENTLHKWYSQYTPDAAGYVASQTRMLNDNTNRLQVQGGVGETFQLDGGHDTRYFYGTAAGDELKRLFGLEVGDPQHYRKTLVKDANGQVSLSYTNQEGKTIATALAQASPANLEKLVWDYPAGVGVSVNLKDYTKAVADGSRFVTQFNLLNADGSTDYHLTYGVNLPTCADCAYTTKIKIIDQNNPDLVLLERTLEFGAGTCNLTPGTWDFQLPVGSYTIYKEVFVKGKSWDELRADMLNPSSNSEYAKEYRNQLAILTAAHTTLLNQGGDCALVYPSSVYLEQVIKEQILTACQMGTGGAIAPSDPRYCEYLACMALADAQVFVKKLYLINNWGEAEKAFGDNLNKTFYQKDPFFRDINYGQPYQGAMEKLLGALSVDANHPPVSIETFMASSSLDDSQKWALFRRIYLQARQIIYERSLKNTKTAANNFQGCNTISTNTLSTLEDRYWAWKQANEGVFFSNNPAVMADKLATFINQQNAAVAVNDLVPYLTNFYSTLDSRKNPWRLLYSDANDANLVAIKNILITANCDVTLMAVLMPALSEYQNLPQFYELLQPAKNVLIGKNIPDGDTRAAIATDPLTRHDALITAPADNSNDDTEFAVQFVVDQLKVPTPFDNNTNSFDYKQTIPLLSRKLVGNYETMLVNNKKVSLPYYFSLGVKQVLKPAQKNIIKDPTGTDVTVTTPAVWQYQLFAQPFWLSPQAWSAVEGKIDPTELACLKKLFVDFNLPNGLQPCDHVKVVFEQTSERLDWDLTYKLTAFTVFVNGKSLGRTLLSWKKTGGSGGGIEPVKTSQEKGMIADGKGDEDGGGDLIDPPPPGGGDLIDPPPGGGDPKGDPIEPDPKDPIGGGSNNCLQKIQTAFVFETGSQWAWGGTWISGITKKENSYSSSTFGGAIHSIALSVLETGNTAHTLVQRYEAINGSLNNQTGTANLTIPSNTSLFDWLPSQCIASPQMALPYLKEQSLELNKIGLSDACSLKRRQTLEALYQEDKIALLSNLLVKARIPKTKCMDDFIAQAQAGKETFGLTYTPKEYHYTLYYYDQAQNLTATVPPVGVVPDGEGKKHTLMTHYAFNTLAQPTRQKSPDGGETVFFYDKLTRLRLSQNAKQKAESDNTGEFIGSYTQYDAIGRNIETGQLRYTGTNITEYLAKNMTKAEFPVYGNELTTEQITHSNYDEQERVTAPNIPVPPCRYTRNRISSTYTQAVYDAPVGGVSYADTRTVYAYDVHGNVKQLQQSIKGFNAVKTVDYEYDLISGKVNKVYFQKNPATGPGNPDQFIHRYNYDADNRLTQVETSVDDWFFATDASYFYYPHGPLARIELGHYKIQGLDYAYTLQGWLKGVNSLNDGTTTHLPINDMGADGNRNANRIHHQKVGKDVFGFTLHYFKGDYTPVGANANIPTPAEVFNTASPTRMYGDGRVTSLYNGNIAAMRTAIHIRDANTGLISENSTQQLLKYNYDQLNRITQTRKLENFRVTKKYNENYTYDPNGNILTLGRTNGQAQMFDTLTYNYNISLNNQLKQVKDAITDAGIATNDIEHQSNPNNYTYDEIGNLIADKSEYITNIVWSIYGKVLSVRKQRGAKITEITYQYDATGNRVHKTVDVYGSGFIQTGGKSINVVYWRDAQGNVLNTVTSGYEQQMPGEPSINKTASEFVIYGSSRLGTYSPMYQPYALQFEGIGKGTLTLGYKSYELSNHLGNVLTTISDNYAPQPPTGGVSARVLSSQDYYPFGMVMTERSFVEKQERKYRFGFNGMEMDEDMGEGSYTTLYRMLDVRIGRWMSTDPKEAYRAGMSPYVSMDNMPLFMTDVDGDIPPQVVAFLIAGGVEFATQMLANIAMEMMSGKSLTEASATAFSKVDWVDVVTSAVVGGLTCGISYKSIASLSDNFFTFLKKSAMRGSGAIPLIGEAVKAGADFSIDEKVKVAGINKEWSAVIMDVAFSIMGFVGDTGAQKTFGERLKDSIEAIEFKLDKTLNDFNLTELESILSWQLKDVNVTKRAQELLNTMTPHTTKFGKFVSDGWLKLNLGEAAKESFLGQGFYSITGLFSDIVKAAATPAIESMFPKKAPQEDTTYRQGNQ